MFLHNLVCLRNFSVQRIGLKGILLCLCLLFCVASDCKAQIDTGQVEQFGGATCSLWLVPEWKQESLDTDKVEWRITCENRILGYGTSKLQKREQGWSFEIVTPNINPGVVLDTTLVFRLNDSQTDFKSSLRLRSKDACFHVRRQLTEAGLAIYDPVGQTSAAIKELSLEPRIIASLREIPTESTVIVGEGVEWSEELVKAADNWGKRGKFVITLLPTASSTWPLPLSGERFDKVHFLQLSQSNWYPANLDSSFWTGSDRVADRHNGWGVRIQANKLVMSPEKGPQVWELVEYQLKESDGGSLFVGVPMISRWHESPVPRELLSHVLVKSLECKLNSLVSLK